MRGINYIIKYNNVDINSLNLIIDYLIIFYNYVLTLNIFQKICFFFMIIYKLYIIIIYLLVITSINFMIIESTINENRDSRFKIFLDLELKFKLYDLIKYILLMDIFTSLIFILSLGLCIPITIIYYQLLFLGHIM